MSDLSAEIQLRPTRIGFLVHPADLASVRRIMRACTCLWGGVYNPIIPVFNKPPNEWRSEVYERFKGAAVAKGYVRFFEPDDRAQDHALARAGAAKEAQDLAVVHLEADVAVDHLGAESLLHVFDFQDDLLVH